MAKTKPPPWTKYGIMLRQTLAGAWHDASAEFTADLLAAFRAQDEGAVIELADNLDNIGKALTESVTPEVKAIFKVAGKAGATAWKAHATDVLGSKKAELSLAEYLVELEEAFVTQLGILAETYPERVLHAEILRQLSLIVENPFARIIDVEQITERVKILMASEHYWEGFSHLHISRLWQSTGVELAYRNGVDVMQVVEVMDKRTCPVCRIFHGTEIRTAAMKEKIDSSLSITDPEEYIKAWPFPRWNEIQLSTPAELTEKNAIPPYHGSCRGTVRFLYST